MTKIIGTEIRCGSKGILPYIYHEISKSFLFNCIFHVRVCSALTRVDHVSANVSQVLFIILISLKFPILFLSTFAWLIATERILWIIYDII